MAWRLRLANEEEVGRWWVDCGWIVGGGWVEGGWRVVGGWLDGEERAFRGFGEKLGDNFLACVDPKLVTAPRKSSHIKIRARSLAWPPAVLPFDLPPAPPLDLPPAPAVDRPPSFHRLVTLCQNSGRRARQNPRLASGRALYVLNAAPKFAKIRRLQKRQKPALGGLVGGLVAGRVVA